MARLRRTFTTNASRYTTGYSTSSGRDTRPRISTPISSVIARKVS